MTMFFPWTSDKEPKPPVEWGVAIRRRATIALNCKACNQEIHPRKEYLYSMHQPSGAVILHNTKECWEKYNGS